MNSAEEISRYKESVNHYYSPTLSRRFLGYGYDFPEKSPKKDKKWSIGSLFRRKKKEESESSSEEEAQKKGFLGRKKKKSDKKKKNKPIGTFDHVVLPRTTPLYSNGYQELIYPSYNGYTKPLDSVKVNDDVSNSRSSLGSSEVTTRKNKKGLRKVRAEARRTNLQPDSSSDEDSQRSSSSRFRSDENLLQRDGSFSRRSRAARTERYLKRHSKDGENPNCYLRLSKSDAENSMLYLRSSDDSRSMSRSPLVSKTNVSQTSSISGLSTIPPSHGSTRVRVSNSTSNPSYKPPLSMNEYNYSLRKPSDLDRSISCEANIYNSQEIDPALIRAQYPVGKSRYRNLSLVEPRQILKQPPPPPPRDPRRLVTAQYYDNTRPNTCYVDKTKSFNLQPNIKPYAGLNCRSTSEDHLPKNRIQLLERPSSTTPEAKGHSNKPENFNYLADKKPRSRRPIFIRTSKKVEDKSETQKALDFWKQKDREENVRKSPQMFTCKTHVQTEVFLPSVVQSDMNSENFPQILSSEKVEDEDMKRKSSNLEEALDELEAIYNSLRLGDEDLLERAEQREKETAEKKFRDKYDMYPTSNVSRGFLSDSSFSYEPFDTVDSPRRKRFMKKSQTIDRKADDMAYRKLHKERSATINDPQSVLSKVSYLNASPVYNRDSPEFDVPKKNSTEPDVTLDDVVYRNVKFANSVPKVLEPQPPFGIPVGPVTPAPSSDYLHAIPDNIYKPTFKPRRIPDLVKDDLAFRNLRKDSSKEPQLSPEDLRNNNGGETKLDLNHLKKKRAVRSLSANIGSLVSKEVLAKGLEKCRNNNKDITDIADAMEIARQVLREKENKITATRRAFLSDTDNGNDEVAENRMNFLNSMKVSDSKPPRGLTPERRSPRSPKESTPIPISPLEEKLKSRDPSLDNLLSALATEARETNERISNELLTLDDNTNENCELEKTLSDIDAVSEQAKKLLEVVDTELMTPSEEVQQIEKNELAESVANVVLTREDSNKIEEDDDKVESDHDYENLKSDQELTLEMKSDEEIKCISPFEEHKAELIATFQELKKGKNEDDENVTGERCVAVLDGVVLNSPRPNCDSGDFTNSGNSLDSLESLKSPRLVLETEKLTNNDKKKTSMLCRDVPGPSTDFSTGVFSSSNRSHLDDVDDGKASSVWYRDPATLAVACSYGIACAHQLASLDFVAILGVLFAVLSFIAALIF